MHRPASSNLGAATAAILLACGMTHSAQAGASLPASDGSAGSFDAQFRDGSQGLVSFNTDNGVVTACVSGGGCFTSFTVPYKTIQWNGQALHAFNFTDITVEAPLFITILGSTPAVLLASQDVSFAGHFIVTNAAGAGGLAALPGGNGGPGGGTGGGLGGAGTGGETAIPCGGGIFTGGGGGGGGNKTAGGKGLPGFVTGESAGVTPLAGGPGGPKESASRLQGGGGGGSGGGGNYQGRYYAYPGASGGGAIVFSATGAITIAPTGIIDVSGAAGDVPQYTAGGGGGGAGGDAWFYAKTGFSNAGTIAAGGGVGGSDKIAMFACRASHKVDGPDGGSGGGGVVKITAPGGAVAGHIDVGTGKLRGRLEIITRR